MATKILDIDIDSIIKKSTTLKAELDSLRKQQAKMKKDNDTSSESYVKLEARLKNISSEYGKNQTQLANLNQVGGDFLTVNQKITASIAQEVTSIEEARKNVSELTKLRNQLNLKDKEQLKLAEELNKKIDQNNDFIKENVSQLEKQKIGIGDYASGIRDAIGDTGLLGGELKTLTGVVESFKLPLEELKTGFTDGFNQIKNATAETEGLTKAQKAQAVATNVGTGALKVMKLVLASLGIGLIIAAVVLLIGYLRTFDPLMDKLEQGFSAVGAVIEVVAKVIFDFVRGLTDVGATIQKVGNFLKNPIMAFKELGKEMKEAAEAAIALKKAQQDLEDQTILQEIANAKASQQVKELMLQSKNLQLTEEERLALLEKANKIEQDNYNQRAKLAEDELDIARRVITTKAGITDEDIRRLKKEGTAYAIALKDRLNVSDDEVKALQQAEIAKIKILEESTAIREKIQNQTSALEEKRQAAEEKRIKEIEDARNKAIDNRISKMEMEFNFYREQTRDRERTGLDLIKYEIELAEREKQILAEKLKFKRISQIEYNTQVLRLRNDLDEMQKDLDNEEIQRLKDFENRKRELLEELRLKREADEQERDLLKAELDFQKQVEALENLKLTEEEKTELLSLMEENRAEIISDIRKKYQEKELENFRIFSEKQIQAQEQRASEEIAIIKEMTGIFTSLLGDSLGAQLAGIAVQAAIEAGLISITSASAAAKNLAQATAAAPPPLNAPFIATALAQNAAIKANSTAAIAKVLTSAALKGLGTAVSSSKRFQKGGILEGPSHAHGGIQTPFGEMEGKEAIINKRSTEMFKPLLSAINVAGGGRKFARGGIPNATALNALTSSMEKRDIIDIDALADKIGNRVAEANMSLPPNKLSIEEFNLYQARFNEVVKGASFE